MDHRSVGVEEELLLVEPETGQPRAVAGTVLLVAKRGGGPDAAAELELELQEQQLETASRPCSTLGDLHSELRRCRTSAAAAAARTGVQVAALATSPIPVEPTVVNDSRYQAWGRWPGAGPTEPFRTAQAYHRTVQQMVLTGTLLDTGMIYFDARLSERYPTIEVRIADVCLRTDDAVLIAALVRALVETEARAARAGEPAPGIRSDLLRLAGWRASRSGLDDVLLNPLCSLPEPAAAVAGMLLDHCREALADAGDADTVDELLAALFRRGNGAAFQRAAYHRSGSLRQMIGDAVTATQDG